MTHVPYRGASPALNDLIPGRVDCYFGSGALLENTRLGQLRGLAVTSAKRDPVAPDLPTMAEAGVPGYEVSSWHGLFVPAKTPPEIVIKNECRYHRSSRRSRGQRQAAASRL